jgi:hypothetical protein
MNLIEALVALEEARHNEIIGPESYLLARGAILGALEWNYETSGIAGIAVTQVELGLRWLNDRIKDEYCERTIRLCEFDENWPEPPLRLEECSDD